MIFMRRFEYYEFSIMGSASVRKLDELGKDDWEMCGCILKADSVYIYYFKREFRNDRAN